MSWVGSDCQGDRRFECYYLTFDTWEEFCRDRDDFCPSIDDNAGLTQAIDHQAPSSGGGW